MQLSPHYREDYKILSCRKLTRLPPPQNSREGYACPPTHLPPTGFRCGVGKFIRKKLRALSKRTTLSHYLVGVVLGCGCVTQQEPRERATPTTCSCNCYSKHKVPISFPSVQRSAEKLGEWRRTRLVHRLHNLSILMIMPGGMWIHLFTFFSVASLRLLLAALPSRRLNLGTSYQFLWACPDCSFMIRITLLGKKSKEWTPANWCANLISNRWDD